MKARIAAWLMALAMSLNGGPVEIEETEIANPVPETIITEYVIEEDVIPEINIVESFITEEHEGEIFEVEDSEENYFKKLFADAKVSVADAATVTWGTVSSTWDTVSDKIVFWD